MGIIEPDFVFFWVEGERGEKAPPFVVAFSGTLGL